MIEKLILVTAIVLALSKQKNIPNTCYHIGKIIRKAQNTINEMQNLFWSLYDIGEIDHFKKQNNNSVKNDMKNRQNKTKEK